MRNFFGCLYLIFVLPIIVLAALFSWFLSRVFDSKRFESATCGIDFDYIGRWSTGDYLGFYGMFGAIAPDGINGNIEVTIYYSRFQEIKRDELEKRTFLLASSCTEIPVATKHGGETHFSFIEDDQLIWFGWDIDGDYSRDGWFSAMRPGSYGSWALIKKPGAVKDEAE